MEGRANQYGETKPKSINRKYKGKREVLAGNGFDVWRYDIVDGKLVWYCIICMHREGQSPIPLISR